MPDGHVDTPNADTIARADARPDVGGDSSLSCSAIRDTPERWQRFPFLCDCDLWRANEPSQIAPMVWRDCDDVVGGRELVVDWGAAPSRRFRFESWVRPEGVWTALFQENRLDNRRRILVGPIDGVSTLAFESSSNVLDRCSFLRNTWAENTLGLEILVELPLDRIQTFLVAGPPRNDPTWSEIALDLSAPEYQRTVWPYFALAGREFATTLGLSVDRSSVATRSFRSLADGRALGGETCCVQLAGDETWFLTTDATEAGTLWSIQGEQAPRRMYGPTPRVSLSYFLSGDHVVVFETLLSDRGTGPLIIKVGPRTTDPAQFAVHRMFTLPATLALNFHGLQYGDGWLLFATYRADVVGEGVVALRLSDGSYYNQPATATWRGFGPQFITSTEIGVGWSTNGNWTVRRLPLASLGPLNPPQF